MTKTLPASITASTRMDALCHAIESYTCMQKNPLSDAYATTAINLIRENLVEVCKDGKNETLRLAMANASLMAGIAFSNSMIGIIHAIGHALGGVSHVPHGDAMAILMPHCMRYNLDKLETEYAELLLPVGGSELYAITPKDQRAQKTISCIEDLREELHKIAGLPTRLKEVGVKREDFTTIAETALKDGALIVNPKEVHFDTILEILDKAF